MEKVHQSLLLRLNVTLTQARPYETTPFCPVFHHKMRNVPGHPRGHHELQHFLSLCPGFITSVAQTCVFVICRETVMDQIDTVLNISKYIGLVETPRSLISH